MRVYSLKKRVVTGTKGGVIKHRRMMGKGLILTADGGDSTTPALGGGMVRSVPQKMDLSGLKQSLSGSGAKRTKKFINLC